MNHAQLCEMHHITIHQVGEIYDEDESGRPIPEDEKDKWFVAVRAEDFPSELVRSIPLAATYEEALANAVTYLGLLPGSSQPDRGLLPRVYACPSCGGPVDRYPLPAPMWKLILFPALLMSALLVGGLQLDGVMNTGLEITAPAYVIVSALLVAGILGWFLSMKDGTGMHCSQCGYSE